MFELDLEQEFNAPIARLYEAWLKPEVIKTWFAPGNMTIPEAESDGVEGGKYRIVMKSDDGELHIVSGEFKSLNPYDKIVFSWQWQGSPHTTLVAITLTAIDEHTTKLQLNHSEFTEEGFRDHHKEGWHGCLANLKKVEQKTADING